MPGYTPLMFGKFKGKTLPQVVFVDPDYFFWLHGKNILHGRLRQEADEIYGKATAIRLLQPGLVAEYSLPSCSWLLWCGAGAGEPSGP